MHAFAALLDAIQEKDMWDIIWLCELDGVHGNLDLEDVEEHLHPHKIVRHYGGEGNTSYAFIIHSNILPLMVKLIFESRSAGILLAGAGAKPLAVVGLYGHMHGDCEDSC